MTRLIPISQHPSNLCPTAKLVQSSVNMAMVGREIYQVRGGYLATLNGMAVEGLFDTQGAAEAAQRQPTPVQ